MMKIEEVKKIALSYPETDEHKHFDIISIRVKKKIFATLNLKENRACLKLSLVDQDVFAKFSNGVIYPVPNAWGKYGWTLVNLQKISKTQFKDALNCAFCNVAPLKLSKEYQL
jgi:hypothetical protein